MQNMQEYESIQRHNYNQLVCVGGWFCSELHSLDVSWRESTPPTENLLDEIIQDAEFNRLFDAYDDFDDAGSDDEDVGGGYGDGVDGGPSMVAVTLVVTLNLVTVIS
jgi:hypothetical protein